ncbi:MAG TPA: DNA/RNA non-specific endonuclease [Hanamia sp.]|nr:DNA/RNA non-specific endonuclease [Hanamia sp.]
MIAILFYLLSLNPIVHKYYTIHYDYAECGPDYTEYWLTRDHLKQVTGRPAKFTCDPSIEKTQQAGNKTYRNSGYDKGHLSPADDFKFDQQAEAESMYYTNVAPQQPYFNEHLWKAVEDHIRKEAEQYDSVYVITGVVYSDQKLNGVGIPSCYYKEIEYNGTKEFFIGKNERPTSNDYKSIEVDEKTFEKEVNN